MALFGRTSETSSKTIKNDEKLEVQSQAVSEGKKKKNQRDNLKEEFRSLAYTALLDRIDLVTAQKLSADQLKYEIEGFISDFSQEKNVLLNAQEQRQIAIELVNEMIGLGPLEEFLQDDSINDILINGSEEAYIERKGKLERIHLNFYNEAHLLQIARRIVARIGRRVDESSPMVDARLADGSRVNIIIPPLALNGTVVSIRKFTKVNLTLEDLVSKGTLSEKMKKFLAIAAACRLNILVSGGTGSGKTTALNALSRLISPGERIITIEDAAELRLQQPHVVRLEGRPPNIEGEGEVTIRDLVVNSLRMRPDRIIVGEVRGSEVLDMMQAMNTGHDGSMSTIHANRPREVITRLENMMAMSGLNMPIRVMRAQIVGAINLIVHVERMHDGVRRITNIMEINGMEDETVQTTSLFTFEPKGNDVMSDNIEGEFRSCGYAPGFMKRAEYFGLGQALSQAMG